MRRRNSHIFLWFLFLLCFSFSVSSAEDVSTPVFPYSSLFQETNETHDGLYANHNVMVVVPHQDDCINLFSGITDQYLKAGSTVRFLYVTNGDFGGRDWGERRISEAIDAMSVIGIPPENIIFLGYGDQWHGDTHIYNAPGNTVVTSYAHERRTYGSKVHKAYNEGNTYTRNHLKQDLRSAIEEYLPDTIFCIDYDGHKDHRAVSLFFEEVMGEILSSRSDYTPTVFKGFGYDSSWNAPTDFYADNILSTTTTFTSGMMDPVNYFKWENRIRFPVSCSSIGRLMGGTSTYQMLRKHVSQKAWKKAESIINGDKVYWIRETSSLLYHANISVSSGDKSVLTNFKLIDSSNVNNSNTAFSGHIWKPDMNDNDKTITVSFDTPVTMEEIWLYDNPNLQSNVLNAEILFDDGTRLETGELKANGSPTIVSFNKKPVSSFAIRILQTEGINAGLSELEAYEKKPNHSISWIKLMNSTDNFIYDYWVPSDGNEVFTIYSYPNAGDTFYIDPISDDFCSAVLNEDTIEITCPPGHYFELTVHSASNPSVSDTVRISNPSIARRKLVSILQEREQKLNSES